MDRYFKTLKQKSENDFTKLGPAVCLVGKSGIGKTWAAHCALGDVYVELTPEILKSKADTNEFLDKIRGTDIPVLLDAYETVQDLVGLRELGARPTQGLFLVTSQIPPKFDFEICLYEFPVKTFEHIKELCPEALDEDIHKAQGDLRRVFASVAFTSDSHDEFMAPKDFITSLVSNRSNVNPCDYLGWSVSEPGNCSSILNANYVNGPRRLDFAGIANSFSEADVVEDRVFRGEWELWPYFNTLGVIMPAVAIGHTLKPPLNPGSTWTRYQNMCMRHKKIQAMSHRIAGRDLDVEGLLVLRDMAEKGQYEILKEYGIQPADIDVMNHLNPYRKLKAKTVSEIKKWLSANATSNPRSS